MRRMFPLPTLLLVLLLAAPLANAEEGDPSVEELAQMILEGNDAEHALVARWLEDADRATLRALFSKLRSLRGGKRRAPDFEAPRIASVELVLNVEVYIVDVAPKQAKALLGKFRPTTEKHWNLMTGEEVTKLVRAVEKREDASVVTAPRLTVYVGQKANVSVLNQVAYIKDYDMEVAADGTRIANPIVDTVQDGLVIEFKGSVEKKGKAVRMDFLGTWASLKRPIEEREVELGGRTLKRQFPEVTVTRAKVEALLPDDGWAMVGTGELFGHGKDAVERVALVNVKAIELEGGLEPGRPGEEIELVPDDFKPPAPPKGPRIRKK